MGAQLKQLEDDGNWLLASKAQVLSAVLRIFGSTVAKWYETEAKRTGVLEPKTGGLHFPQRFGGSLNVHVHDHSIFVDGGVFIQQPDGSVHFVPSRAPTQTEIVAVAAEVGRRVINWLRRRGYFGGDGSEGLVIEEQTAIEACMQVGMSPGNFERITERGQPDATIERDDARFDHRKRSSWRMRSSGRSRSRSQYGRCQLLTFPLTRNDACAPYPHPPRGRR